MVKKTTSADKSDSVNKETLKAGAKPTSAEKKLRKEGVVKDIIQISIFVLLALVFRSVLLDHYVIPSGSMIPTLLEGDRVIVSKISYGLRVPFSSWWLLRWDAPKRGDVIVFSAPTDGTTFIKRVVGLPGDSVAVRNGMVIINGQKMPFSEANNAITEDLEGVLHEVRLSGMGGPDFGPEKIPDEYYFMLGDNRGNSQDSRFWGFLDQKLLLGHAMRIYYRTKGGFEWQPL